MIKPNLAIIQTSAALNQIVVECHMCPRLVEWRQEVAREKVARYQSHPYWGRPVPSFGALDAQLLIIGLAPAAHGGNRTGRMFTGDRSGDWLYRALHRFGFASQPHSHDPSDGLQLQDCYITATVHCAPPSNKPLPEESLNCRCYLEREWQLLTQARVVVALGKIAFDTAWAIARASGNAPRQKSPPFHHGLELDIGAGKVLLASFHPSQQNTFTRKLTESMFDEIFARCRSLIGKAS